MIEDFLSLEVGPLRQDDFILKWKWEDASEEVPLSISDLIGDAFDEEQGEGQAISFEERTGDVVVNDLIEGRLGLC